MPVYCAVLLFFRKLHQEQAGDRILLQVAQNVHLNLQHLPRHSGAGERELQKKRANVEFLLSLCLFDLPMDIYNIPWACGASGQSHFNQG